jgi:DNA-binding NtrC family response regulator
MVRLRASARDCGTKLGHARSGLSETNMAAPDPAPPTTNGDAAEQYVVLVVEDEILIRLAIADHLRDAGFRVYEAANAHEAVDLLTHYANEIDTVFSDIMMPGPMDGFGLMGWIATNCPAVPVVLTSGVSNMNQTIVSMRAAGLFFLKPYDMDKVAEIITARAIARAQRRDENKAS